MEEKKALNNEEMNGVSGGVYRTVDTRKPMDAVVRSGPGMSYPQIASLKNGTQVNTTGNNSTILTIRRMAEPGMRSTIRCTDGWQEACLDTSKEKIRL